MGLTAATRVFACGGHTVIAFGQIRLRFKSGVTLEQEIGWVARYRDGVLIWGRTIRTRAEAPETVGLSG